MTRRLLLLISFFQLFSLATWACHETTALQVNATDNLDGTFTYELDVCMGSEDTWGFELSFTTTGSIVSVNTASITDPGTGVTITPTITGANTLEFGDFDNTAGTIFHAGGSGQACFPISVTIAGTTTDVTVDGTEFIFGPCSGTAALTSCFPTNADYVITVTTDVCAGNNVSFELQDALGAPIAGVSNLLTDGNTRSYVWCGGCATFFEINAPASTGGTPSTRCDPGLCCVEGNGGYSVTTGGGSVVLVSSSMTNTSIETSNISNCNPLLNNDLISFNAYPKGDVVELVWVSKNILAGTTYQIQKSQDGLQFDNMLTINQADAVSGEKHFSVEDFYPNEGVNYYRLRFKGPDNVYFYSDIVMVDMTKERDVNSVSIFPNPAKDAFQIYFEYPLQQHTDVEVGVYDLMGRQMIRRVCQEEVPGSTQSISIPIGELANGLYSVKIDDGQQTFTRKLIVAH